MDMQDVIDLYTMAPLTFVDVITEKITSETLLTSYNTMRDAGGLIFPVTGTAKILIDGTYYVLDKGKIIHVGPNLNIQRIVANNTKFNYAVIHFKLPDESIAEYPLYNSHFAIEVEDNMKLMNMLQQLIQNYLIRSNLSFLQSKALFLNILEEIILLVKMMDYQYKKKNISVIMEYMQENFAKNITVLDIASQFNIERRKLTYIFEKRIGVSPTAYLTDLRIQKSKLLLRTSGLSIKEIAERVGYMDYFYFSRVFKKETGLSPTHFRKHMN
ncbi:helix-turn-helix transcriptional regulator [Lysinibacillus agricola]|uniref:Helix-turn-helix transcriptional regulator n=1 Tax=Lysinibacillus agricola TaxID=2590012 RepID=A0ABX7AU70_9BACI|nr:helix-turn-helix domain-containing protein [Lysinibacillus agricola]QQP12827.1 helix-turn-helix transcriptional regulator [Lysinibacillus agricola]